MECLEKYEIIIAFSFFLPVLSSLGLLWFLLLYQKKRYQYENDLKDAKMREQQLVIQNQESLENERNRIASEMHDELGSGLTVIKYLSDAIFSKTSDIQITADVQKIAHYSTILVGNMSEIIWAMNSRFDNLEGLIGYLRRYVVEFLEDNNLENSFIIDDVESSVIISGERRRNLFLVIKELLNNSVKYAQCDAIDITVEGKENLMITMIERNAIGFDPILLRGNGNGLYNVDKRMRHINGTISYQKIDNDMVIKIYVPLGSSST